MKMSIEDLQNKLGKPIERNITALGVDTASRTGWAIIKVGKDELDIDYGFIDIKTKDHNFLFNHLIDFFNELIKPNMKIVIENVFLKFNVSTLAFLARIGGLVYCVGHLKGAKDIQFIYPVSSRKNIGIKGTVKKADVHKWLIDNLGINLTDEDASDAIVLALNGVIKQ